jgi:putative membrane protein
MLGALTLYFMALAKLGPSRVAPGAPVATRREVVAFVAGVLILWIASDWPIHDWAENYLYSVHMLEHELITLAGPPLILIGMPSWLVRELLSWRPLGRMASWASRPLVAGIVFNVSVAVFHIPAVVDFTLYHHNVHFFAHVVMFVCALIMWWPVLSRLPEYGRMSYPAKMLYLFFMTVVPDVPIFFALGTTPIDRFYATVPRPFSLTTLGDQQLAAGLMNYTNIVFFGCMGAGLFFRWWAQEETMDRKLHSSDTLTWDDIRADLERASRPEFRTRRST